MKSKSGSSIARIFAANALIKGFYPSDTKREAVWNLQPREKGIRNPKDPVKKAAIVRRRKAKKLSMLSKPKRRAVYHYNLQHPVKMYS